MTKDSYTLPSNFFNAFRDAFRERFPKLDATITTANGSPVSEPFVEILTEWNPKPGHSERFRVRQGFTPGQCERINRLYREGRDLRAPAVFFVDVVVGTVAHEWPEAWPGIAPLRAPIH